jgi:hypothetical protein
VTIPDHFASQLNFGEFDNPEFDCLPSLHVSRAVFARHNTFHPRFGWLRKGFDAAVNDRSVFARADAPVALGVGKNMVRAIRFWCVATRILREAPDGEGLVPSALGWQLLGPDGLDPFLENLGSLWLLHWRLLGNPDYATAWWFVFFQFARIEFTIDELSAAVEDFVVRQFPSSRYAISSLKKDAACIARMYGEQPADPVSEEAIHCPFAELALLRSTGRRTFGFQVGPKPGLSPELVAAASLEYAAAANVGARSVSLGALVRNPGSPGLAFRLGESALFGALENATATHPALRLTDAGGLVQLSFDGDPLELAQALIRHHYERSLIGVF